MSADTTLVASNIFRETTRVQLRSLPATLDDLNGEPLTEHVLEVVNQKPMYLRGLCIAPSQLAPPPAERAQDSHVGDREAGMAPL